MGYLLGIISIVGCASVFPYRYYATQMPESCYDSGMLLGKVGKDGWRDLPLNQCKPDDTVKLKCVTMIESDFYALKLDNQKCHLDLDSCQRGNPPNP